MKKVLPIILILIFVLTGIASADAPFELSVTLNEAGDIYDTTVIVYSGDQVAIKLGNTDVTLNVQEKQKEGLNFMLDPMLYHKDEKFGNGELGDFLLPEDSTIEFSEPGNESSVLTISWKELTLDPLYWELIEKVTAVLDGTGEYSEEFSIIFRMLAGREEAKNAGFFVIDLDGDKIPELLFGENQPYAADETVFYDMYTLSDGQLVHVFDGWDRSRYYLCENGGIAHEGSSSAFNSSTGFYYYTNGELRLMMSVIYDASVSPDQPWYLSSTSEYDISGARPLDEAEARYTIALYPYRQVELDPFLK